MLKTMTPRILQIQLRRWLHDRKLPQVNDHNNSSISKKKIGTKSPRKESEMKINASKDKNTSTILLQNNTRN